MSAWLRGRDGLSWVFWLCAAAALAGAWLTLRSLQHWNLREFVGLFALQCIVYAYAAWRLLRRALIPARLDRRGLIAVLAVALLLRAVALLAPQTLSTDAFRYVWDGRVQAAGVNPYRYVPRDPALAPLRDRVIYPNINRADYAHTIYPPAAQLAFLVIEKLSDGILAMKIGMLAFEALAVFCLIALLQRQQLPASRVLLYAWHPLPVWEFAGSGHVDAVALAFVMAALLAASRRAAIMSGIAIAAAALVKFYPAVIAPALYRRWDWRMPFAAAVTVAVLYLPYLGVGSGVLGFLSGYADEEGLRNGTGIFLWSLLRWLFPVPAPAVRYYAPFAAIVMIILAATVQWARNRFPGETAPAMLLAGSFTVLASPHDPWYFTWLVPLLALRFSVGYFWLTAACTLMYILPEPNGLRSQSLIYVPFFALLVLQYLLRRRSIAPETVHANLDSHPSV